MDMLKDSGPSMEVSKGRSLQAFLVEHAAEHSEDMDKLLSRSLPSSLAGQRFA